MSGASTTDAIVVGGGPAGASTAWHLARAGGRVLVLDRARFPRDKPCAEYLSPEASRVLHAMGALESCERAGAAALAGMMVRAPGGARIRGDFAADHGFHGFRDRGLALRRRVLDAILVDRARAAGADVLEGHRVVDVLRDARGRVIGVRTLDEGGRDAERRATLVVGADGLRSVVARRLGLTRQARWPRRLALVAHWRGVRGLGDRGEMHVERGGYVGLAPVDDGLVNVAAVFPAPALRSLGGDPASFLERWLAARAQLAPRFAGAVRVSPVRATGPFAQHARRAWAPGAALVGDAADFFDPFTGEGIYTALRGGELLGASALDALGAATDRARDDALAGYDAARRGLFAGKWRVERAIAVAVALPWLMDRVAGALEQRKDMADLLVGVAGDFVPAREVLGFPYIGRLALGALRAPRARTARFAS